MQRLDLSSVSAILSISSEHLEPKPSCLKSNKEGSTSIRTNEPNSGLMVLGAGRLGGFSISAFRRIRVLRRLRLGYQANSNSACASCPPCLSKGPFQAIKSGRSVKQIQAPSCRSLGQEKFNKLSAAKALGTPAAKNSPSKSLTLTTSKSAPGTSNGEA